MHLYDVTCGAPRGNAFQCRNKFRHDKTTDVESHIIHPKYKTEFKDVTYKLSMENKSKN